MCGIAIVVCGVRIGLTSVSPSKTERLLFSEDDIKLALQRRGPDSLGTKKVYLELGTSLTVEEQDILSSFDARDTYLQCSCGTVSSGNTKVHTDCLPVKESVAELHFFGATLQLRGLNPISQPLVDSVGNILVYNGEIFGGILVGNDCNDTEFLMEVLEKCCSCKINRHVRTCNCSGKGKKSIPDALSEIKGPWAVIYWEETSRTLWFGRDALGRRSLLVHWPTVEDSRFLLSSVSPTAATIESSGSDVVNGNISLSFWEELQCGIYSISVKASNTDACLLGEVRKHDWTNIMLKELVQWERNSIVPTSDDLFLSRSGTPKGDHDIQASCSGFAQTVLIALRESVQRRTSLHKIFQVESELCPVAVLFSGGLDSMIIAALLDQCLDPKYEIDLFNVSFDGRSAPDRISARAGIQELRKIAPLRRWKLIEIDANLSSLILETKHVTSLINPSNTYMDLNIGIALWLAASGDGWLDKNFGGKLTENQRVKYKSKARILLVGAGADEQCAGYGRHRTKYRNGSWSRLNEEMKLDMQRIWKRNLGRDDRCIADNGKEARFPFLDEDVIKTLLMIPLWEIADLDQPSGIGDKKILREVAQLLGLKEVASLPKRAIQFGSRIARESNRKNFGSNRAANQASAGSVKF